MMLETFKTLASIINDCFIEFCTKKEMIEMVASFDEEGLINFDNDCHWTIFVGEKCYVDEEITPVLLKKACYIEFSHANGWNFYVGRNCSAQTLSEAYECSLGWSLECSAELGELTDAQLDAVAECGIELEFAARNREWNAEEAAQAETVEAKEEAPAQIQVVIHAGYEYVNKPVASLEEAVALKAEYRAKTQEFDRFSFKCFDPAKVQFDRWGDIIAGGYEV